MDEDRVQALKIPGLDFNGDGQFTVSDAGEWVAHMLLLPGDLALDLLMRHAPAVAEFLELGPEAYGGMLSLTLSVFTWVTLFIAVSLSFHAVRNFDRWITNWIGRGITEFIRQCRIARRRLTSWIGMLRQRRQSKASEVQVTEVKLETFDAAVLRCYASIGDMRMLAASDVAKSLKASLRQVRAALRRLCDYRLVEPAFGTDDGQDGHCITQAGQIYLLER